MDETSSTNSDASPFLTYAATAGTDLDTDDQLVAQVERKNRLAFEVLCKRYTDQALELAGRILENRALAEQVVQEAFWWVWKYPFLARNRRADFSDWFYGIVEHAAITEMNRRLPSVVLDMSRELPENVPERGISNGAEAR